MPLVQQKWLQSKERRPELGSALDAWHGSLCLLRQFMKGWNIQKSGEQKNEKNELLLVLESIDAQAEKGVLTSAEWEHRYEVEDKLEQIYQREKIYWKQRGDEEWVLQGDTNSKFFHQFASGRRRKNIIRSLDSESGVITSQDIENHITSFYKGLFDSALLPQA